MPPVRRRPVPPVSLPTFASRYGAVASVPRGGGGQAVVWEPLPAAGAPAAARTYPPVGRQQVLDTWHQAHQRRAAWLQDLYRAPPASLATSKDLATRPRTYYMRAFHKPGRCYVTQMADIGRREGFDVMADTRVNGSFEPLRSGARSRTLDLELHFGELNEWTEDDGFIGTDGSFSLPARLDDVADFTLSEVLLADRAHRLRGLPADFPEHGAVALRRSQLLKVSAALAAQRAVRENLSYVEGGNCLLGVRPGGEPYALVGRDSVAATRALLARQLGRSVSQRTALTAIAKDLGLRPGQAHPVEQPCEFHLDMDMVAMAPGQVLLNDARWATQIYTEHLRREHAHQRPGPDGPLAAEGLAGWHFRGDCLVQEIQKLWRTAATEAEYEGRAHQDLRAAGLDVVRVPARFPEHNFLNGEGGTNARGERFFVTQGGEPWLQAHIADFYLRRIPTGLQRVYFLDADASRESLDACGGLGCRATAEAAAA